MGLVNAFIYVIAANDDDNDFSLACVNVCWESAMNAFGTNVLQFFSALIFILNVLN